MCVLLGPNSPPVPSTFAAAELEHWFQTKIKPADAAEVAAASLKAVEGEGISIAI
jgi:hypothetical protein